MIQRLPKNINHLPVRIWMVKLFIEPPGVAATILLCVLGEKCVFEWVASGWNILAT